MWRINKICFYYVAVIILALRVKNGSSTCNNCADDEENEESYREWQCDDGDKIPNDKLCDGIVHCTDGSDETVLHCLNVSCPAYAFRCTYGACIQGSLRCDGKKDCFDGSDEMSYLCSSYNYERIQIQWQGRCRSDLQLQCKNGDCIIAERMCDGKQDCTDGTDEIYELCNYVHCPDYAFRCGYGGCVPGNAKCNGIVDCVDGSDEFETVCGDGWNSTVRWPNRQAPQPTGPTPTTVSEGPPRLQPPSPSSSKSPLPLPTPSRPAYDTAEEALPGDCTIPLTLNHLIGVEDKSEHIIRRGERFPSGTRLRFYCTRGWRLEGARRSRCHNGIWTKTLPHCLRNCLQKPLTRGISTQATCIYGGNTLDCATNNLPVGTQAKISCATGYHRRTTNTNSNTNDDNAEQILTCTADAEWDQKRSKCEPICGRVSTPTASRKPWDVSIFRRSFEPIFEFVCFGTIISPRIVVTAANCLRLIGNNTLLDSTYYNVVEAVNTDGYVQSNSNGFVNDIHNISEIVLSPSSESLNARIALFVLVHHFRFSPKLSPICFDKKVEVPSAAILTVPSNLASQSNTNFRIGNIISNNRLSNDNNNGGIFIDYISGVVSEKTDNGTLLLIRVHYYKEFIVKRLRKHSNF